MGGVSGVDGDEILRELFAIDEDNHQMRVVKKFRNEKEFEAYKRRYRASRATRMFASGARKMQFRTVKKGGRVYRFAVRKRMGWEPKQGTMKKHKQEPRIFPGKPIDGK